MTAATISDSSSWDSSIDARRLRRLRDGILPLAASPDGLRNDNQLMAASRLGSCCRTHFIALALINSIDRYALSLSLSLGIRVCIRCVCFFDCVLQTAVGQPNQAATRGCI